MADAYDLSPSQAAAQLGVYHETLKRWAAEGKVKAFRTPGGWWRFRQSDIDDFLRSSAVRAAAPVEPVEAKS